MTKPRFYQPCVIKPHPRVRHLRRSERYDVYIGEPADLIEAGVLQAGMVPTRTSLSWRPAGEQREAGEGVYDLPGYLIVTKNLDGQLRVQVTVSREEQQSRRESLERRQQAWRDRMAAERTSEEQKREAEHARRRLSNLTSSHEEFRSWYASFVGRAIRADIASLNEHFCCEGFTMSGETLAEFFEAVDEALDLLRRGTSEFRQEERTAYINELRVRLAKGDESFRPFLSRVLQPLSDEGH